MDLDSPARAATDALQSVLKKRLFRLNHEEHRIYIEIECARIVETLRVVRDTYREYLRTKIDGPLVEMYWVVVRFGVRDWAVMRLREAALEYILASQITKSDWTELYRHDTLMLLRSDEDKAKAASQSPLLDPATAVTAIRAILGTEVFNEIRMGGPFGSDSQTRYAGPSIIPRRETLAEALARRLAKWEACLPWTEGLARLFDSAQEEVLRQFASLDADGAEAERAMRALSLFEQTAYKHLVSFKHRTPLMASPTEGTWRLLVKELDKLQVPLEANLDAKAVATLSRMRQKGSSIKSWHDCFACTARVTLDDGKSRTLRREMMHSVHNAAKNAALRLDKIWGKREPPKKKPAA